MADRYGAARDRVESLRRRLDVERTSIRGSQNAVLLAPRTRTAPGIEKK